MERGHLNACYLKIGNWANIHREYRCFMLSQDRYRITANQATSPPVLGGDAFWEQEGLAIMIKSTEGSLHNKTPIKQITDVIIYINFTETINTENQFNLSSYVIFLDPFPLLLNAPHYGYLRFTQI